MTRLIMPIFAASVIVLVFAALLRPRLSYWRWSQLRREFFARWLQAPLVCQQSLVALVWSLSEWPHLTTTELEPLLLQALDARWAATQRDPQSHGDLTDLTQHLEHLLEAATESA